MICRIVLDFFAVLCRIRRGTTPAPVIPIIPTIIQLFDMGYNTVPAVFKQKNIS